MFTSGTFVTGRPAVSLIGKCGGEYKVPSPDRRFRAFLPCHHDPHTLQRHCSKACSCVRYWHYIQWSRLRVPGPWPSPTSQLGDQVSAPHIPLPGIYDELEADTSTFQMGQRRSLRSCTMTGTAISGALRTVQESEMIKVFFRCGGSLSQNICSSPSLKATGGSFCWDPQDLPRH